MSVTLLTLSRHYAAGKLSRSAYRESRRALIDGRDFVAEERTMPGISAPVASSDQELTLELTRPGSGIDYGLGSAEPGMISPEAKPDTTTFNRGEIKPPERVANRKDKKSSSPRLLIGISAGCAVLFAAFLALWMLLGEPQEHPEVAVHSPVIELTEVLLHNPEWRIADIAEYRQEIEAQKEPLYQVQRELLETVNLYLSVPSGEDSEELQEQVQLLRQDLQALKKAG